MKLRAVVLFVLAFVGVAFAQDLPKVGVYQLDPALTAVVGGVLGIIISPLTALLKKWFKTEGVTTQLVHFVLSVLIVAGIGFAQGAFGQGVQGVWSVVGAVFAAFFTGLGSYTLQRQAVEGALKK